MPTKAVTDQSFESDVIKVGYKNFQVIDDSGTSNCIDMPYDNVFEWRLL